MGDFYNWVVWLLVFVGMILSAGLFSTPQLDMGALVSPLIFLGALVLLMLVAAILARRRRHVFRVPARMESIRVVVAKVRQKAEQVQFDEQAIYQCRLALDEACTNIIEHSYADKPDGEIEVVIRTHDGELSIQLTDFGEPYNPAIVPTPQIGERIENARPGGLGLYMMRTVMDEVSYTPGPRGNSLVMVKRR